MSAEDYELAMVYLVSSAVYIGVGLVLLVLEML